MPCHPVSQRANERENVRDDWLLNKWFKRISSLAECVILCRVLFRDNYVLIHYLTPVSFVIIRELLRKQTGWHFSLIELHSSVYWTDNYTAMYYIIGVSFELINP